MTDILKINILLPHFNLSGGAKAAMEYANRLHRLGHCVTLIAPAPRKHGIDKYLSWFSKKETVNLSHKDVKWFPLECRLLEIPDFDAAWLPKADIHVATSWQTALPVAEAAKVSGKGFYLVQHHESIWCRERDIAAAEASYSLPLGKLVISSWLKKIMKEKYASESLLIVTPVNEEHFYPDPDKKQDPLKVSTMHHNYDWKGFPDVLEALKTVRKEMPEVKPVIFGAKIKTQEEFMQEYDFPCEYHYSPPIDELRGIYSNCGIFVCSSWHEGLGMPAMEAMACGSALVTTDTGGCWDYATPNETALVSPPKNPGQLAENILKLLKEHELRTTMARKGQARIKEFTWDDNVRRMLELFNK